MRRVLLFMMVGGIALLTMGIGGAVAAWSNRQTAERAALDQQAQHHAQLLDQYLEEARANVLVTAQNPAFTQFYALPGSRADKVVSGAAPVEWTNEALAYLERLYPDRIGEACFIDASGAENARVVRGVRATADDLSLTETETPFFAPTFALPAGQVYQTAPYVSPDTNEWVIANATRVPGVPAIVHFEVTIESFRREAGAGATGPVLMIDSRTGAVVIDSRHPQRTGAPLGTPDDHRFAALTAGWGASGRFSLDGAPGAYRRVADANSASHWYVVSLSSTQQTPLSTVGTVPILIIVLALLIITYALIGLRKRQALLVRAAHTDALTGLRNRRALDGDLLVGADRATTSSPLALAMFDLNGFKSYNDTFGHPAGDALLARLGAALNTALARRGRSYRLGGDEFCILASVDRADIEALVETATQALSEHGEGFSISAAHGVIVLPDDARDPDEAMRLVDLRMYEQKASGRIPPDAQTSNALLRALRERDPALFERMALTAALAEAVSQRLGLSVPECARIVQAARIHDIGKVAVPETILAKPDPLTAAEWAFIRQTPIIGERITAAAPALAPLAPLIRSAREHFDGTGYPDALRGADIPIGATIVAACAALAAMINDRPYAPARSLDDALHELDQWSGSQFAPDVVDALGMTARAVVEAHTLATAGRQ